MNSFKEFRKSILKLDSKGKKAKIPNSSNIYSAYKWIRKNKWFNIGRPLTEHEFYSITRSINNALADELVAGNDVTLPLRMGTLELRKKPASVKFKDGKLVSNLPIDWNSTLKLWYEDNEAYEDKTLVRITNKEIFQVYYNKLNANYDNQMYYYFKLNRDLKQRIKEQIKRGDLDAFSIR